MSSSGDDQALELWDLDLRCCTEANSRFHGGAVDVKAELHICVSVSTGSHLGIIIYRFIKSVMHSVQLHYQRPLSSECTV